MEKTDEFMKPKMTYGDTLRFTTFAWAKLLWMRDRGDTEVAGYGITGTKDPLLVTDFVLVKQECTGASFDFDADDGVDYMNRMFDTGLPPWAFSNLLLHTHPGNSPQPSSADEKNFEKAFSHPNWAIMFIIAQNGATYCRLKINVGPGVTKELKVVVDWSVQFTGSDTISWEKEYKEKVNEKKFRKTNKKGVTSEKEMAFPDHNDPLWHDAEHDDWVKRKMEFSNTLDAIEKEMEELDGFDELDYFCDHDGYAIFDDGYNERYLYDPVKGQWYQENYDREEEEEKEELYEIATPDVPWVTKAVAWAEKHADEREHKMAQESF